YALHDRSHRQAAAVRNYQPWNGTIGLCGRWIGRAGTAACNHRVLHRGCCASQRRRRRWRQDRHPRCAQARARHASPHCRSANKRLCSYSQMEGCIMKRFNLSEWSITHQALVLFMIMLLGAAGAYSYVNLGRAEDPNFTIKVMVIGVGWPGATADEVQTQVTDKIEKKLQELPYLDRVETYSQPGGAFLQVILSDTTPPAKVKDLWYQVRKKVGDIKNELPAGITGPNFNDEFGDVYSALYMLTADGLSLAALKDRAEDIRQRLLRVPDVNKVDIIRERPQKIFIEFSHTKLATLGVTPQQIFDSIARQNAVVSGGSVDTSADRINLRVTGAFSGVAAIAAVPVHANGQIFRLGDIATVKRGYEDPPSFIIRQGGKPALGLGVSRGERANPLTLGKPPKGAMPAITAELPLGIEVTQVADQPRIVDGSVSEFVETFAEALVIVLAVSFLSLGWRTGIVVALSVPLVL